MIDLCQAMSLASARQFLLSIAVIVSALPTAAQQNSTQDLKTAAAAIILQRTQLYNQKEDAGIASQFTADAVFVELLPRLTVVHGKAEIQKHYQQLVDAGAANFNQKITEAEPNDSTTGMIAGDYSVVLNGKTITGNQRL
jgi:ketosteroid isomerase-like protein